MDISFVDDKGRFFTPFKEVLSGSLFEDVNTSSRRFYIKTNEACGVDLFEGCLVDFDEDYKVRVVEDYEYKFEVFI